MISSSNRLKWYVTILTLWFNSSGAYHKHWLHFTERFETQTIQGSEELPFSGTTSYIVSFRYAHHLCLPLSQYDRSRSLPHITDMNQAIELFAQPALIKMPVWTTVWIFTQFHPFLATTLTTEQLATPHWYLVFVSLQRSVIFLSITKNVPHAARWVRCLLPYLVRNFYRSNSTTKNTTIASSFPLAYILPVRLMFDKICAPFPLLRYPSFKKVSTPSDAYSLYTYPTRSNKIMSAVVFLVAKLISHD